MSLSSEVQSPTIIDNEDSSNKLSLKHHQQQQMTVDNNFGSVKPKMWTRMEGTTDDIETDNDFETNEKMFLRKIKFNNNKNKINFTFTNDDEYFLSTSGPFVRFLNEFEGQKSLFRKEGIEFDKIFKEENLSKRPLSRYTLRGLKNRHLEVLTTLLMMQIEKEQEEYRKLMRLAEELCMMDDDDVKGDNEMETIENESTDCELLKLKALCHEHLHLKRVYISSLRKIRSGAVYSLFQANNLCSQLHRLDRKLAFLRRDSFESIDQEEAAVVVEQPIKGSDHAME